MPTTESVDNATVMKQRMYHFLAELVPFLGERPADFVVHRPARQRGRLSNRGVPCPRGVWCGHKWVRRIVGEPKKCAGWVRVCVVGRGKAAKGKK